MFDTFKEDKKLRIVVYLFLVVSMLMSCSKSLPTNPVNSKMATVNLRVSFESSSQMDLIDHLLLTVTADDMVTIEKTILIHHSSFEDSLTVPAGAIERLFVLEGKDLQGETVYSGSTSAKVEAGDTITVDINLLPAVLMIKMTPRYTQVEQYQPCTLSVEVYNVVSLFGASFRIEYDNNRLQYSHTTLPSPQGVLGPANSVIFFDTSGTDYVAVSITRKRPASPVDSSGALAQLHFQAISPGTAKLVFSQNTLRLTNEDGDLIPNFDGLVRDEGTVEITKRESGVIVPLEVGNYWVYSYLEPDGTPSGEVEKLGITGCSTITYQERQYLVYFWNWFETLDQPFDEFWLMNNQDDGLWMIGYAWDSFDTAAYFPNLTIKYPAEVGDAWEYVDVEASVTMECVSTGSIIKTPAGTFECYAYLENEEYYVYFAPGIGYVGYGATIDGQDTEGFRLIEYHLEFGSPTPPLVRTLGRFTAPQAFNRTEPDERYRWLRP